VPFHLFLTLENNLMKLFILFDAIGFGGNNQAVAVENYSLCGSGRTKIVHNDKGMVLV